MNWKEISKALTVIMHIVSGFAEARTDGDVSPAEICAISADVARLWAESENKKPAVTQQQLIFGCLRTSGVKRHGLNP